MPEKDHLRKARIRFGESVSEAMSDVGGASNASNDCAVRDQVVELAWFGKTMVGPGGFRFLRIDNHDPELDLHLEEVRATLQLRDLEYLGAFDSSDDRLDEIWRTGARTVHLNMQEFLWDGIKRDRLVWVGDMHPEIMTILAVFGPQEVITDSLDLVRDVTPASEWMNTISSYSLWWIIIQHDLWFRTGDDEYLRSQKVYLEDLLGRLTLLVDEEGGEILDGVRFVDWPTSENPVAVHEGLQSLMTLAMSCGERLMAELGNQEMASRCLATAQKLKSAGFSQSGRKVPAALSSLAGLKDAKEVANETLKEGGPHGFSTFGGYYVLEALAQAREFNTGIEFIRQFWGGMLDLGATTFWEDFDLNWMENASRIDELVAEGTVDVHATYGDHSYKGHRNSLCHGWASGPTAWLSEHVLGVRAASPGFEEVRIEPNLGGLSWVKGKVPTPFGVILVSHHRAEDGTVVSDIHVPDGITVLNDE
ncbi:alpha-L-rhamnosidase C-terminal domain-containing protein [Pelagicoccus enzymogenes]|uniref:alpha-L-rhamnosidase-related protein n=1 Tax=Pelagicoccus enzymogenes TaxID=2773457 RepID=UPI003CCE33DD